MSFIFLFCSFQKLALTLSQQITTLIIISLSLKKSSNSFFLNIPLCCVLIPFRFNNVLDMLFDILAPSSCIHTYLLCSKSFYLNILFFFCIRFNFFTYNFYYLTQSVLMCLFDGCFELQTVRYIYLYNFFALVKM